MIALVNWLEHFQATAWEGDHKQRLGVILNQGDIAENSRRKRQAKYVGKTIEEKLPEKIYENLIVFHEFSSEYL